MDTFEFQENLNLYSKQTSSSHAGNFQEEIYTFSLEQEKLWYTVVRSDAKKLPTSTDKN